MSRFKIRRRLNNRLNTTKLKVFENAKYVAGNSSALMEKLGQFLDIGSTVAGSGYSARKAAIDVANAAEDYTCQDYRCFILDCVSTGCDLAATGIAFLPKTNVTGACYAGCSAGAAFTRTLRNHCKSRGGLLGC